MVNRHVVGAGYGLRDWIMQRVTAVVMVLYTVALALFMLALPSGYEGWKSLFSHAWVQLFTQVTLLALFLHVWVGIRDVWMDYVKPVGIRLALHVFTIVWLVSCFIYSVKVVWGL
ncbi:succinate dehydrogenase, hydrophobic membrane anchor protein [Chromobacterium vaccinii]|uniref:Succinate dehydrogenase hydrophobic membrane anchor subunit n=1 Tax=Chromobacterium vaccinii TaxID=1108595 RepID=A0A1D9LKL6_9NEIS|nr:succinate dehydrogenase, hydrophobic membrane anchor protein [Chromobacterium vaccinii]AOZ51769.1 succinate dehydrogenase, hydrophobic membrane anchor protein [Chromobacterium vaccinii]MCD4500683.1 succinate dehydrogenase, hydrophobic membrane anchor protein [Chromobacterium vaccinii]QND86759.1 Succinate dehydrogenase hydrophobic membrane anchor protein [Chromobacterium vaccinii]QND91990.1 Succinate dehydrogenase hydrophobic membrane anchor protein [Chromobacterium vaccinii]SUX30325.1 Succi